MKTQKITYEYNTAFKQFLVMLVDLLETRKNSVYIEVPCANLYFFKRNAKEHKTITLMKKPIL